MTSRSIFQKVCPSCMISVSIDTCECICGYQFDHDGADTSLSSEEIRLKAEQLYESYLAARAEQSANAIKAAQAEFTRDPINVAKSDRVADAIHEAQAAKAALDAQSARIAEMKKLLRIATPSPADFTAPPTKKKRSLPAPKPVVSSSVHLPGKQFAVTASRAVPAPDGRKHMQKIVTQALSKQFSVPASAPKKPEVVQSVQTAVPNSAFRQAQAAKAEKILHADKAMKSTSTIKKEEKSAAPLSNPSAPSLVIAATTKAPRLYVLSNKKDCPNCTASVDIKTTRCRCGYEFSSSEAHIPPLAMSEEDRAEFAKLFSIP